MFYILTVVQLLGQIFFYKFFQLFILSLGLHEVVRNNTKNRHILFTQFPTMVASFIVVVPYHNQEMDSDTIYQPFQIPLILYALTSMCVCMVFSMQFNHIDSCDYHQRSFIPLFKFLTPFSHPNPSNLWLPIICSLSL